MLRAVSFLFDLNYIFVIIYLYRKYPKTTSNIIRKKKFIIKLLIKDMITGKNE